MMRVFVATDNPALRERFTVILHEAGFQVRHVLPDAERILAAINDESVMASAEHKIHAARAPAAASPEGPPVDVLVIDAESSGRPVADVLRQIIRHAPFVGAVVISGDDHHAQAAAWEAGARAVLSPPFVVDDVRARVEIAAAWGRTLRAHVVGRQVSGAGRGTLVTVTGAKGGVGVTVASVVLSAVTVAPGRSVCLVDLDVRGGDVAFHANVTSRHSVVDLAGVAADRSGRGIREIAVEHESGVTLILAPEQVERAEEFTAAAARAVVSELRTRYDVVIADCGHTLDDVTAGVIEMADETLLLATADVPALRAARKILNSWERLAIRGDERVSFVLNRVSRRVEVQPELASRVVGLPVLARLPAAYRDLEPVGNTGALLTQPPGVFSGPIRELARALRLVASPADFTGNSSGAKSLSRAESQRRPYSARSWKTRATTSDAGQVAVETPVIIGGLVLLLVVCLQMLTWGVSHLMARHAAAEAARVAVVQLDAGRVNAAVEAALPPGWSGNGQLIAQSQVIRVTVQTPRLLLGFGSLAASAEAAILTEPQ
ncbi:MAG: AAA family ATPase [Actinomycetota bacterium]